MAATIATAAICSVGAVLLFWNLPPSWRAGYLAAVSYLTLLYFDPLGITLLGALTGPFYVSLPLVRQVRFRWLAVSLIASVLGYLVYAKYLPALLADPYSAPASSLAIPLGISYFTFKLTHVVIEAARGRFADVSLQQFCCYVFLLPTFTAGPIERLDHFLTHQDESWQLESTVQGLTRIVHGLIKKFVLATLLANQLGDIDQISHFAESLESVPVGSLWAFSCLQYLYVYLDFSAYCDLAIGTSRLFGIRIMENFNWPLVSSSIIEFWTRWHMTLRGWCQSYIYLPVLGLWRQPYLAVYATLLVMGLWHEASATYICWGLYHASGVALCQAWRRYQRKRGLSMARQWSPIGFLMTQAFVSGSFVWSTSSEASVIDRLRILVKMATTLTF